MFSLQITWCIVLAGLAGTHCINNHWNWCFYMKCLIQSHFSILYWNFVFVMNSYCFRTSPCIWKVWLNFLASIRFVFISFLVKGIVHPKIKIMSFITHVPSCRPTPVRPSFIFGKQIVFFCFVFMKSESFLTLHWQQGYYHDQGTETDVFKIVHVTSVVQPKFCEAMRILFSVSPYHYYRE